MLDSDGGIRAWWAVSQIQIFIIQKFICMRFTLFSLYCFTSFLASQCKPHPKFTGCYNRSIETKLGSENNHLILSNK